MQQTVLSGSGSVRMQNTTNLFGSRGAADLSLSTPMLLPSLLIRSPRRARPAWSPTARVQRGEFATARCARSTARRIMSAMLVDAGETVSRLCLSGAQQAASFPALSFSHPSPGNGRVALQLRASDEHCFIVRVLQQEGCRPLPLSIYNVPPSSLFIPSQEGRRCCSQLRPSNEALLRARVPLKCSLQLLYSHIPGSSRAILSMRASDEH